MKLKFSLVLALIIFSATFAQNKKWTLQECVAYALENNISIKQMELNTALAEEEITAAKGNFYPSLNASASQNFNFGSFIDINGGRISRDSRSNSFGLNTGVVLFNGNRNKNNLIQAQKNLQAAGFNLEENKNGIMLFIVNSYLNVLLGKENVNIAQEQVKISEDQVAQSKKLVDAGSKPQSVLLEAQASLANNQQQLTASQNNVDLALLGLAQLLQLPATGFDVADVALNITSASLIYNDTDAIYQNAVNSLPEIKSAEISVENAETGIDIAKAGFYPSLSFGAGLGTSYQHNQGQKDVRVIINPDTNLPETISNRFATQLENNLGYNYGFSLNIPIFNRFQNKVNLSRAEINFKKSQLNLIDRKIKLRESVERAYADAKAALNQYVSAETSLKAQQESFKNAQASYNLGVMTSFDFDQVRARLVNAQSALANAKYNFVFRTKLLEFYLGIPIVID